MRDWLVAEVCSFFWTRSHWFSLKIWASQRLLTYVYFRLLLRTWPIDGLTKFTGTPNAWILRSFSIYCLPVLLNFSWRNTSRLFSAFGWAYARFFIVLDSLRLVSSVRSGIFRQILRAFSLLYMRFWEVLRGFMVAFCNLWLVYNEMCHFSWRSGQFSCRFFLSQFWVSRHCPFFLRPSFMLDSFKSFAVSFKIQPGLDASLRHYLGPRSSSFQ